MSFVAYGRSRQFPRSANVDIVVREIVLNPNVEEQRREYVEIREFLKNGEVFGHGVVIPRDHVSTLLEHLEALVDSE